MAFTSFNDILSELSAGKTYRSDWWYRTTAAAATSTSVSAAVMLSSYPGAYGNTNTFPGTSLSWVGCDDSTGNGTQTFGIPHGGNVSPDTKHLMNATTICPPAGVAVGGSLILADLQGYWANINLNTTTTQTLTGTPSLRYTNGEGCRLFLVATATTGATAQNYNITYRDTGGNSQATGAVAMRPSSVVGQVASATPHVNSSIFVPLLAGDTGVSNCVSITMSALNTGTAALCLARPLAYLPLTTAVNISTEREFLFQTPGLPRIYDGACLTWLYQMNNTAGNIATATGFQGQLEFAWG